MHHHDETWQQVRWRFEREAIALQRVMPGLHMSLLDFPRYFAHAAWLDFAAALREGLPASVLGEIVRYRFAQYHGSYRGNHAQRELSKRQKAHYFYPKAPRTGRPA